MSATNEPVAPDAVASAKAPTGSAGLQDLSDVRSAIDAGLAALEHALAEGDLIRADLEQRLARAETALAANARALTDVQAERDAIKVTFEHHLAESEKGRVEAVLALADAVRAGGAASEAAERHAARLTEAEGRILALEQETIELVLARDVAEAHLEGEVTKQTALAAERDVALEQARQREVDAEAHRAALQRTADRVRELEERHRVFERDAPRRPHGSLSGEAVALADVRNALHTFAAVENGPGLLEALLERVAPHFSRVAVCAIGSDTFSIWGSRGFDPPPEGTPLPLPLDSPLRRAVAERQSATTQPDEGQPAIGLTGHSVAFAVAIPVLLTQRSTAVVYAENLADDAREDPGIAVTVAEILAAHVRERLGRAAPAVAPLPDASKAPTGVRRARRLRVPHGTRISVDGISGTLVDLSTLGAQVVSARAIAASGQVRLLLPSATPGTAGLWCQADVVWVRSEPATGNQGVLNRAGLQFMNVNGPAIQAFLARYGAGGHRAAPTRPARP